MTDRVIFRPSTRCWWYATQETRLCPVEQAGEWVAMRDQATRMDAAQAMQIYGLLRQRGYEVQIDHWQNPPVPERTRIPEW